MKIKFLLTLIIPLFVFGQEYLKHFESIKKNGHYCLEIDADPDSKPHNCALELVDSLIAGMEDSTDRKFISDRNLLRKIHRSDTSFTEAQFKDQLKNGQKLEAVIGSKVFNIDEHEIEMWNNTNFIGKIDGSKVLNDIYGEPNNYLGKFNIRINNKDLIIPDSVLSVLIEPHIEVRKGYIRGTEMYESINGKYIYVYVSGGYGAGFYWGKLVFNHEKYITSIFASYPQLSSTGSFRKEFIGF